jgi:ribosomal protein S18 acetylase RimI-like enzyme
MRDVRPHGTRFRLERVDHTSESVARLIHSVQMSAYAQEARLLGAVYFPPLARTVDDVRNCQEEFFAALAADELIGAVSVWPDPEDMGRNIASLVVAPSFQRRGVAKSLMAHVLRLYGSDDLTVQTGVKNEPALNLYKNSGFVELRRWFVGREPLELVILRRPSEATSTGGENAVQSFHQADRSACANRPPNSGTDEL